jgi:HPt (histidine-containing phosphotransfer) domain-containing protein
MLSERAQKLVAEQRRLYVESMPVKKHTIMQCMTQVNAAIHSGKTDLCENLPQQVHRLAGSAGIFGFESLGQAAAVVDRYLIANSPGPGNLSELASMLQILLNEIDDIIQKGSDEPSPGISPARK